jgi:hypothetical protein
MNVKESSEKFKIEYGKTDRGETKRIIKNEVREIVGVVIENMIGTDDPIIEYVAIYHNTILGNDSYFQLGGPCESWESAIDRIKTKYRFLKEEEKGQRK